MQSSLGEDEDFGDLISRLFPVGGAAGNGGGEPVELWAQAQALPAGTTVAFLLVEHRWARGLFDVIDEEGGSALGAALLTPQLGLMIETEVTAMEEAARSIAAAQASEVDAWLSALAAQAEAEEAMDASARIRATAAAEALRALTDAGLVEQAAAHEAVDALRVAGLIVATADEAADRAVEADASTVAAADEATAASITPAEIRVLRYPPPTLTFAFIADKLGISRGAAKSRAERAYKKLGVHNRGDAVVRARALRVLP